MQMWHVTLPIPDGLPFEQAAIIPDAVSTSWAEITATAQVRPAEAARRMSGRARVLRPQEFRPRRIRNTEALSKSPYIG